MEDQKPTHILLVYPSQASEMLFRASDGICIGMAKKDTVVFGDEPNKRNSHVFMNHDYAMRWLRDTASADDLKARGIEGPVVIEERNAEPVIQLAPDSLDFPAQAGRMMPIKN